MEQSTTITAAGTTTSSSSFSFLSAITGRKHDVFLSFRGEDTRRNIAPRLHEALVNAGVPTFKDDVYLEKGCDIASDLLRAIQASAVAVVIFSRNYATSRWCLDELAKIVECKAEDGQVVVPVFYDVDPAHVADQTGSFEAAFRGQEERLRNDPNAENKLMTWRNALKDAATAQFQWDLNGVDSSGWDQSLFLEQIVKEITKRRLEAHLSVAILPTSTSSSVEYLNMLLSVISTDVLIIGICGIDTTSIATAVYNQNYWRFESSSFLKNVSKIAEQSDGLITLQKQFLADILGRDDVAIENVKEGIAMIERELPSKRVLVVLDNVNKIDQLNALARKRKWFGPGSRIVVTTRDAELLDVIKVDHLYGDRGIQVIEDMYMQDLQMIDNLVDFMEKSRIQADERIKFLKEEREGTEEEYQSDGRLPNLYELEDVPVDLDIELIEDQLRENHEMIDRLQEIMRSGFPTDERLKALEIEIETGRRKNMTLPESLHPSVPQTAVDLSKDVFRSPVGTQLYKSSGH